MQTHTAKGDRASIDPEAYCESMCVFLLLSGKTRYVPEAAHVRVHQIWMGDRADDAKAASYTAQDLMIVERDIGRLAKYTFDMGGAGDLLSLSLNVPPWEDLHELSREELRLTNLVTTDAVAEVLPRIGRGRCAGRRTDGQTGAGSFCQRGGRGTSPQAAEIDQDGGSGGSDRRRHGDAGEVAALNPGWNSSFRGARSANPKSSPR